MSHFSTVKTELRQLEPLVKVEGAVKTSIPVPTPHFRKEVLTLPAVPK